MGLRCAAAAVGLWVWILSPVCRGGEAPAPTVPAAAEVKAEWLAAIHPDMRYTRTPLAEEQNAFPLWEKAVAQIVKPGEDKALASAYDEAVKPDAPVPGGPAEELLAQWVAANHGALELIGLGLGRGGCQYPEITGPETLLPYLSSYREVARILLIRAKMQTAYGDFVKAREDLATCLEFGDRILQGEGCLIHCLVGFAVRSLATGGIRWFSRQPDVPAEALEALLPGLVPDAAAAEPLVAALRQEISGLQLPVVRRIVAAGTPEKTAQVLGALLGEGEGAGPERDAILLLARLPGALDPIETLRLGSGYLAGFAQAARAPWRDRSKHVKNLSQFVAPDFDKKAKAFAAEMKATGKALSEIELQAFARERLGDIANPLGRLCLCQALPGLDRVVERLFLSRTDREATRAVVAVRLFAVRNHRLPATLQELVDAKVIAALPVDPFCDEPLRYSAERHLLWSVGPDGQDNQGKGDPQAATQGSNRGPDLVCSVTALPPQ
jgi:hypothetical protein